MYIDYGNSEMVSVSSVKELLEEFKTLPSQALMCSLHGVSAASGHWSEDAGHILEDLILERVNMAIVMAKDKAGR